VHNREEYHPTTVDDPTECDITQALQFQKENAVYPRRKSSERRKEISKDV